MSELSPEARTLLARERESRGPTQADRARVRARLEPAWAALRASESPPPARHSLRWSRVLLSSAVLTIGFVSSGAPHPRRSEGDTTRAQPLTAAQKRANNHDAIRAQQPTAAEKRANSSANDSRGSTASVRQPTTALSQRRITASRARRADEQAATALAPIEHDGRAGAEHENASARRDRPPCQGGPEGTSGDLRAALHGEGRADGSTAQCRAGDALKTETTNVFAQLEPPPRADMRASGAGAPRSAQAHASAASVSPSSDDTSRARTRQADPHAARPLQLSGRSTSDAPDVRDHAFLPEAIDDELSWLSAAQEALRHNEPTRALQLVQEHAFRFPRGALAQERRAVQVLALCALQRKQAARTVLHELELRAPSSPLVSDLRRSCGL